jgi:hypothetical protein
MHADYLQHFPIDPCKSEIKEYLITGEKDFFDPVMWKNMYEENSGC